MNDAEKKEHHMEKVMSHGQLVYKGQVKAGDFVKGFSIREGSNSYYEGTWEELEALVMEHFEDHEPGTGSVDGDVLLVNVPPQGFRTSVVEITDANRHLVEEIETVRAEGENPYLSRVIRSGMEKQPANFVKIVIYRADVLAQDDDRSTEAEWEIVSINAQNDEHTPMNPTTMLRNANHDTGGTKRTYTQQQWDEAYAYWDAHAYVWED
jgi:hypothetical protein